MQVNDPVKRKLMDITIPVTWKSVGTAITALIGIIGTTSYVVWEVRKDVVDDLKRQIATYEQSKTWKLPDTLTQLNGVSNKLQRQLATQEQAQALKLDNARLVKQSEVAAEQLTKLDSELKSQTARLRELEAELQRSLATFEQATLKEGESVDVVKNRLVLGVSSIYFSWVSGSLNNEGFRLDVGRSKSMNISGRQCSLVLSRIKSKSATFKFNCA